MASATPSTDPQAGLEDIIVTESKVTSNVETVPVAISTFTGDELLRAGVTDVTQTNKLVPGSASNRLAAAARHSSSAGLGRLC